MLHQSPQEASRSSFVSRFLAQAEQSRLDIITAMMLHITIEARAELFDESVNLANARVCNELLNDCLGYLTTTPRSGRTELFAQRMLKPLDDGDDTALIRPSDVYRQRGAHEICDAC